MYVSDRRSAARMSTPAKRASAVFALVIATELAAAPAALAAAKSAPAGGAAIGQVIAATLGAMVATAAMLGIVVGHRSGRLKPMKRLVAFSERVSGMPAWSAMPLAILGGAPRVAGFRVYL